MKLVRYNGGIVSFKLPLNWKESDYNDGEATYYRDDEDSGTLRINVTSMKSTSENDGGITLASDTGMHVQEGYRLKEEVKYMNEDGDNMLIYFWDVYVPIEDKSQRVVSFSYSILESQQDNPLILEELNFVRNTILTAHYSQKEHIEFE